MGKQADNLNTASYRGSMHSKSVKLARMRLAYLADLPGQIHVLTSCLEQRQFDIVKKHAHRIKGTSGTYRLGEIAELMAAVETAIAAKQADVVRGKLDAMPDVIETLTRRNRCDYETLMQEEGR